MAEPVISEDVQDFLREYIESYEQLGILVLLYAHPERSWDSASIASELRITEGIADEAVRFLCRENLLSVQVGAEALLFKYGPRPPELDGLVGRLVQAYDEQRLEVMKLMTANAVQRVRTKALRKFADSFLVGRKKNKDG